jgi:hypothetical protein
LAGGGVGFGGVSGDHHFADLEGLQGERARGGHFGEEYGFACVVFFEGCWESISEFRLDVSFCLFEFFWICEAHVGFDGCKASVECWVEVELSVGECV